MLLFIGLIAGTVGSLVGLGGGIIIVPLLIGLHSLSPQLAVGTSMVTVVFTGLSSTLTYMKHKRVDYKSGLILFIGSGPGGIIGSWANKFLNQDTFSLYFGIFLIFVSILLMLRDKLKPLSLSNTSVIKRSFTDNDGNTVHYQFPPFLAIFIAFIVGFISGLFGIGGGALLVPAMMLLLHSQTYCSSNFNVHRISISNCKFCNSHLTWKCQLDLCINPDSGCMDWRKNRGLH